MSRDELLEALCYAEDELCWYRSRVEGVWPGDRLVSVSGNITSQHVASLLAEPLVPRLEAKRKADNDFDAKMAADLARVRRRRGAAR